MAKLYAELSSDKGGRKVSKGGNEYVIINVQSRNEPTYRIIVEDSYDELAPAITVCQYDTIIYTNQ